MSGSINRDIVTARFLFNVVKRNKYQDVLRDAVVGDYKWSARVADFSGWLLCNGAAVSRTAYAELFNIIGTSFGAGNGTTTFNLPDMRGRVPGGVGTGAGLTARTMGNSVGYETHTLSASEIPSHTHSGTTASSGSHSHNTNADGGQGGLGLVTANGNNTVIDTDGSGGELNVWTTPYALTVDNNGAHTHTFTTDGGTGGGGAHNNMQPTLFLGNVFIYSGIEEPNEGDGDITGPGDTDYQP